VTDNRGSRQAKKLGVKRVTLRDLDVAAGNAQAIRAGYLKRTAGCDATGACASTPGSLVFTSCSQETCICPT